MKALVRITLAASLLPPMFCGAQQPTNNPPQDPEIVSISNALPVPRYKQQGFYTCWAVCAEMIMEHLGGGRIRQCEQADLAFDLFACCVADGDGLMNNLCDRQWIPEFDKWGFGYCFQKEPLEWDQLKEEIDSGRPFAFSWIISPPVGHLNVVVGYQELGDKRVEILEPQYGDEPAFRNIAFEEYAGSSDRYPHQSDYFRIGAAELK